MTETARMTDDRQAQEVADAFRPLAEAVVGGEVKICCHNVAYRYWAFRSKLTDKLRERLEMHAFEQSRECINAECSSGELNWVHTEGDRDEAIRGSWEIKPVTGPGREICGSYEIVCNACGASRTIVDFGEE